MKHNQIIKTLEQFRNITPDKVYSERSKNIILAIPFTPTIQEDTSFADATADLRTISFTSLFQSIWRGLAITTAAVGLFIIIYLATSQLSPLFLPGLNQRGIVAEADMVNTSIDVQLSHIQHFEQTASESASALKEVAANTPAHLNESIIKGEQTEIYSTNPANLTSSTTNDVNNILNMITK
jgi:hypothetical protein